MRTYRSTDSEYLCQLELQSRSHHVSQTGLLHLVTATTGRCTCWRRQGSTGRPTSLLPHEGFMVPRARTMRKLQWQPRKASSNNDGDTREFAAGASSYKRRGFGAADTRFGACSDRVSCVPGIEGGVISKTAATGRNAARKPSPATTVAHFYWDPLWPPSQQLNQLAQACKVESLYSSVYAINWFSHQYSCCSLPHAVLEKASHDLQSPRFWHGLQQVAQAQWMHKQVVYRDPWLPVPLPDVTCAKLALSKIVYNIIDVCHGLK